jgi:flagellin
MSSINTNAAAMAAIRALSAISGDMMKTQSRIETGFRIGKANDDPAIFSIAQTMRSELNGMTAVRDNLAFGKATVTVARDAATKISDELALLKQTITQGQQNGVEPALIQRQIDDRLANIDAFARSATFNGVNLLINPADDLAASGVQHTSLNVVRNTLGNTTAVANANLSSNGLGLDGLLVNNGSLGITFDSDMAFANGDVVNLTLQTGEQFVFEFIDGDSAAATVATLTTSPVADDPGTANTNERVNVIAVVYNSATEPPLAGLQKLMDAVRGAGFGVSLGTNPDDGNPRLVISGALLVDDDAGTDDSVGRTSIAAGAEADVVNGTDTAIAAIDAAVATASTALSRIGGSLRQIDGLADFTKQLQDSVQEGLGALVDADLAEESARLTALQTRQQLATQSLSIANQQSQSLLSLFR